MLGVMLFLRRIYAASCLPSSWGEAPGEFLRLHLSSFSARRRLYAIAFSLNSLFLVVESTTIDNEHGQVRSRFLLRGLVK
jgi:hypothetical protein